MTDPSKQWSPSSAGSRRHGAMYSGLPPLPPGAFDPSAPSNRSPPPPPARPPSGSYMDGIIDDYAASGRHQRMPSGSGEFGYIGGAGHASSSTSRRPLPTQPGPNLPPNPYPTSSMGRRALPTPPSASAHSNTPPPPPRPAGARALPKLPGSGGSVAKTHMTSPASRTVSARRSDGYGDSFSSSDRFRQITDQTFNSPESTTGGYFDSAGSASRHDSLHESSSGSPSVSRNTSQSHGVSSETQPSSWAHSVETWPKDDEGTATTLQAPALVTPATPTGRDEGRDGRRTPTPGEWQISLDHLHLDTPRKRVASSSSVGAVDAGLPATPSVAPTRELETPHFDSDDFPVPHLVIDGGSSRPSSSSTNHVPFASYNEGSIGFPEARPQRHASSSSSLHPTSIMTVSSDRHRSADLSPSWAQQSHPPAHWVERKLQIHQSHRDDLYDDESSLQRASTYEDEEEYPDEEDEVEEVNESQFFNPAFMSEMAVQVKDKVVKGRHVKAGITWVGSFTGRDMVTAIQNLLPGWTREGNNDRRFALIMAHSLQNQLWFVEVDWDIKPLNDSAEDVFRFMGEMDGMGSGDVLTEELPKGVMTMATRCYSPSCTGDDKCYAARCPYKTSSNAFLGRRQTLPTHPKTAHQRGDWTDEIDPVLLMELTPEQRNRQNIIRQAIASEVQYEADLTAMITTFVDALRAPDSPVRPPKRAEQFIMDVFSNVVEILEACRRLMDHFSIRQREQPIILSVGDIFLQAAAEFRNIYPEYTGNLPNAEQVLKRELDDNADFRLYCERATRDNDRRREIKHLITRPSMQLNRYPTVIEAILNATEYFDPDRDFLVEALASIQSLSSISQLKLFHASKGRGPAGKMQWYDLVPEEQREKIEKKEQKRQMQIWELIQGEMEYVADLETIDTLFVTGLREADVPVIERSRLEIFLDDAFHNYRSLLEVHSDLLEKLHARQLEQHPHIGMISDLIYDAALRWREAYMEYVTHYPIAKAKVQEEQTTNPRFAQFLEKCLRDPSANRQDIYHFINRPIPRLLRYNLLLGDILKSLKDLRPPTDPDIQAIPEVMEYIGDSAKATQKGVAVNEAKVELWTFQHSLDGGKFGPRTVKDLDLLDPMRELILKGKVWRQPEGPISSSWVELIGLLFDNYFVLAKPEKLSKSLRKDSERQVRYFINRRPIPLELLSLGQFSDAPRARSGKTIFSVGGGTHERSDDQDQAADSRTAWPFTISFIGQGQLGGQYTLWVDSYAARAEWQEKLQHAKVLRTEVNDAGKVFEMTPLSMDTFYMPPNYAAPKLDGESPFTGRVTCSCPFVTPDGRSLVAVGCEEGVWIGLRHDPRSLRKVLHVKAVTNIAVLEDFGIFLVLQDKSLLAYHLEALVPSASSPQVRAAPQRLSPGKDIVFFTVGQLSGRTLVLYMKKKGMDSLFRVLEPVLGRNTEDSARQRRPFGSLLGQRTDWFRLYKDFFIPTDALNVHFLKHKLAVVCAKGFEIMDLTDLKGGSIPIFDPAKLRDRPALGDLQRRCEAAKPLGMFRSTETEFLLCYDSFGIYVDRHGEPNRDCQAIEWEGRPDSVAFHPPYLLLVSSPFIEIRHIDNAKLLQIYTGSDLRLTWDGTGGQSKPFIDNPGPKGYGSETSTQEPRIHICQRPEDGRRRGGAQGIGQHVFELTPTLLLNNPLLNPIHTHDSNYFPPAPMINHRPPSMMTTTSAEYVSGPPAGSFGNYQMSNGHNGYPAGTPGAAYGAGGNVSPGQMSGTSGTTGGGQGHVQRGSYGGQSSGYGGYGSPPLPQQRQGYAGQGQAQNQNGYGGGRM